MSAQSATIYLSAGEKHSTGLDTIVCGGAPQPAPNVKWWCACFDPNGKNLGQVWGIWAPEDQQTVEQIGKHKCQREKNQRIGSTSCFKQTF